MEKIITIPEHNVPVYTRTVGTSDKAIVFVHGSSQQSAIWEQQLTDHLLKHQFRLIVLDLPGHGASGRCPIPDQHYSIEGMGVLLAACLNALPLQQYVLVGHSIGTNIISEALPYLAVAPRGLFLSGPSIANKENPPAAFLQSSPYMHVRITESPAEEDLTAYLRLLSVKASDKFLAAYKQYYLAADPLFRATLGKCFDRGLFNNEIAGIRQSKLPLCLVIGQQDNMIRPDYLDGIGFKHKWKDTIYKVPAAGHMVNHDQPQIYNHLLMQFATGVTAKSLTVH